MSKRFMAEEVAKRREIAEAATPGLRLTSEKHEQLRRLTEAVEHGTAPVITHEADLAARAFREIERLRQERETLAEAVRAREEARRAAISPYRPSSEPVSETLRLERLYSEACKRDEAAHQKALALLEGGGGE